MDPVPKVGELVDITIKGARIGHEGAPGWLNFFIDGTPHRVMVAKSGVTVERIAPAAWPPRAGDLWRDKHSELWFFYTNPSQFKGEGEELCGRTADGLRHSHGQLGPLDLDVNGPWTLIFRAPEPAVTSSDSAPWPPRKGDLWRDRDGDLWFGLDVRGFSNPGTPLVELVNGSRPPVELMHVGGVASRRPDEVLGEYGPFELVRRGYEDQ